MTKENQDIFSSYDRDVEKMFLQEIEACLGGKPIQALPEKLEIRKVTLPDMTRWLSNE